MTGDRISGEVAFSRKAWADYQHWVRTDRGAFSRGAGGACPSQAKVAQRIARLIEDCLRNPFGGIGNPEPLRHDLAGYWSRRITKEHRLVYKLENERCVIVQSRYHY